MDDLLTANIFFERHKHTSTGTVPAMRNRIIDLKRIMNSKLGMELCGRDIYLKHCEMVNVKAKNRAHALFKAMMNQYKNIPVW